MYSVTSTCTVEVVEINKIKLGTYIKIINFIIRVEVENFKKIISYFIVGCVGPKSV